jgi:hypothetical protein
VVSRGLGDVYKRQVLKMGSLQNTPDKINPDSKTFYQGVEGVFHCWIKDSNTYIFNKDYMFTDEKNHFFELKITKGSKKAELSYGTF